MKGSKPRFTVILNFPCEAQELIRHGVSRGASSQRLWFVDGQQIESKFTKRLSCRLYK